MENTFSVQDGLGYQQDNLNKWKKILIPEVYEHLERYCMDNNSKLDINIQGCKNINAVHRYICNSLLKYEGMSVNKPNKADGGEPNIEATVE